MVRPETMGEEAVQYVVAKYDYEAQEAQELSIKKNEKCILLDGTKKWWKVQNHRGDAGYVPSNFMKKSKPSILSSLRNTLGRRKGSETRSQIQAAVQNGSGNENTSDHDSFNSDSHSCDITPAVAKYAYTAQQPDELSLAKGDHVMVLEKSSDGWWKGRKHSDIGWFPSNYVLVEDIDFSDSNTYANPATDPSGSHSTAHSSDQRAVQPGYQASQPPTLTTHPHHHQTHHHSQSGASTSTATTTCHQSTIDTVIAIYAYSSHNSEELNFDKDDVLDILEKPSLDPDWWRARNQHGDIGLIPRNYVKTLSKDSGLPPTPESHSDSSLSTNQSQGGATSSSSRTPSSAGGSGVRSQYNIAGSEFGNKDWFFGTITRADAEQMLNKYAINGDFIIRASESNVGDYSITLKASKKNKHFRILHEGSAFSIGQQTFDNLDDLVEHYKKHPIYRHDSEKLYLIKSFVHPSDVVGGHPLPELPESPRTSDEQT